MYLRTYGLSHQYKSLLSSMTNTRIRLVSLSTMALIVVLLIAASAIDGAWAATGPLIFPEKSVTLYVDPANNTAGGVMHLHNDTDKKLNISLTARDFVSLTTHKGLNAKVVFLGPKDSAGQSIFEASIPAKRQFEVRVEVTNLWEAGESETTLYNHGDEIGTIKALKYRPPFNVKLVSASPDKPELSFYKGEAQSLTLRNEDGMTYVIHWRLAVDGDVLDGSNKQLAETQMVTLAPNSSASTTVVPKDSWFTLAGFFREETRDGTLTLALRPPGSKSDPGWPVKVVPFKARLNRAPDIWLQFCSYVLILILLLCGGICSLMLSNWVPNQLARAKLKDRLSQLAERIRDLSSRIDSRLQVSLRVARHRLDAELYARKSFSAELPNVFAAVTQRSDALEKLIDQVAEIDQCLRKLEHLYHEGRSPRRLEAAGARLRNARDLLSRIDPPQADIQAAQTLIGDAKGMMEKVDQQETGFAQALLDQLTSLEGIRQPSVPATTPPTYGYGDEYKDYKDVLEELFAKVEPLKQDGAGKISGEKYGLLDICVTKMELIQEYVMLYHTFDDDARKRLVDGLDFRTCITAHSFDRLRSAKQIVQQMRERIFPRQILEAIGNEQTRPIIRMEPQTARQYSPMYFSVEFQQPAFNSCAALEEIKCEWDLGHDGLKERGWEVWHYFPMAATHKKPLCVKATFADASGVATLADKRPLVIEKRFEVIRESPREFGDRNTAEVVRLGIALIVALLGLLSGAREQLLKLDLIPAAVAVFLLGFGADSIKNLLVPKEK
jgi:hypothetical protein